MGTGLWSESPVPQWQAPQYRCAMSSGWRLTNRQTGHRNGSRGK